MESIEPIIKVENLSKTFAGRSGVDKEALKNVSFEVYEGDTLGIVGESGSGKSTIARLIAGLIPPTSGHIYIDGKESKGIPEGVQMVFQNPLESFNPRKTIGYSVTEGMRNKGASLEDAKEIIMMIFDQCGLPRELFDKYPHQLSGGQCQRAAIARALSMDPKILICDEATSALDVTVQKTIIEVLDKLRAERGLTILFICHNLSLVKLFCNRQIVVVDGKIE